MDVFKGKKNNNGPPYTWKLKKCRCDFPFWGEDENSYLVYVKVKSKRKKKSKGKIFAYFTNKIIPKPTVLKA